MCSLVPFFLLSQSHLKSQLSAARQMPSTHSWGPCKGAASAPGPPYLVEVLRGRPHLLPCLVQELDADAEKLFQRPVVGEEHRVEVVAGLTGWRKEQGDEVV